MRLILAPVVFLLDLWAILSVLGSRASGPAKLIWILGIIIFPVIGFLAWLLFGPRK
jgi:hypothetical protein